jgi:hypothetical protein
VRVVDRTLANRVTHGSQLSERPFCGRRNCEAKASYNRQHVEFLAIGRKTFDRFGAADMIGSDRQGGDWLDGKAKLSSGHFAQRCNTPP